jgi:hypothetical protein
MPPRAAQVPIWTWETCIEEAWRPVIFSSTVSVVEVLVTVIVPPEVAGATPFSWKTSAAGEGVVAGVEAAGLGEGDGDGVEPVPALPQAAAIITVAATATNLLMRINLLQLCTRELPVKVT